MTNPKHTDTSRSGDLVKECRLDAKAFRENTVYDSDGDPIRLIANAERLDQYADCIEALLCGRPADPAVFARRVRESDFGRRFGQPAWPNLPMADLTLCAQVDSVDFAMPVRRLESGMLIQPVFR